MFLKAKVFFNIEFVAIWFRLFLKFNPNDDCLDLMGPYKYNRIYYISLYNI